MSLTVHPEADAPVIRRLWLYQAERFPLVKTAVLLAVFSAASIAVSAQLAGRSLPDVWTFVALWLIALIVFFQMRVCDEWKDREDDLQYRPERPVPSGLVSLSLLTSLALGGSVLALVLAWSVSAGLVGLLGLVWLWLGLMTVEFFAPDWLKARPLLYLVSHMAIMPLLDLMITGAEWLPHGEAPPGLWLFLALSFVNGCVLEIGRKVWSPDSERVGVETYSGLLGPVRAVWVWVALCAAGWVLLCGVGIATGAPWSVAVLGAAALAGVIWVALRFARTPSPANQKRVDLAAGLWVFVCYALAGFAPLLVNWMFP